jgi:hypothetical protein
MVLQNMKKNDSKSSPREGKWLWVVDRWVVIVVWMFGFFWCLWFGSYINCF